MTNMLSVFYSGVNKSLRSRGLSKVYRQEGEKDGNNKVFCLCRDEARAKYNWHSVFALKHVQHTIKKKKKT